jgi:hypothetical protein
MIAADARHHSALLHVDKRGAPVDEIILRGEHTAEGNDVGGANLREYP